MYELFYSRCLCGRRCIGVEQLAQFNRQSVQWQTHNCEKIALNSLHHGAADALNAIAAGFVALVCVSNDEIKYLKD